MTLLGNLLRYDLQIASSVPTKSIITPSIGKGSISKNCIRLLNHLLSLVFPTGHEWAVFKHMLLPLAAFAMDFNALRIGNRKECHGVKSIILPSFPRPSPSSFAAERSLAASQ